jgi:DNA-binding GntR family transcriptional regulator
LSKQSVPASSGLADIFRVAPGAPLHVIDRRRTIDGRPVLVERITVDPALAPDLLAHSLDGSLTHILTTVYGVTVTRNRVDMRPARWCATRRTGWA